MKHPLLALLLVLFSISAKAQKEFVNLTPRPSSTLSYTGKLTLPQSFSVYVDAELPADAYTEAERFVHSLSQSMVGHNISLSTDPEQALINLHPYKGATGNVGNDGYRLVIKTDSIGIEAATTTGYYYALQSLKKMLPANVALGLPGAEGAEYSLPIVSITDKSRFEFRSFMLDCSRHFFSIDEIKRLLDIMAIYKMNTFHWHLTDDQGWRAEVKKYPKLTQEGATRAKNRTTPIHMVDDYWWTGEGYIDNHTYGPYFYTQDDMREIVRYAAERHIEVVPEIEMPGHAVAALAAYPEFSCNPSKKYEVWTDGGISSDVLNVANPATMQFLYDIIDEMCDIFPGRYFHIGGDECPVTAWKNNTECQQFKKDQNLASDREIQSYFINQISKYLLEKHNKRTIVWNESITANNQNDGKANTDLVKEYNPVIMCWSPCQSGASLAASLGLDAIITEYHGSASGSSGAGGYYINRRQSADYGEPTGAGAGDDTVEGCYNYIPVPSNVSTANAAHYIGVQGTFWCEHVDSNEYLEYLALPRLICMAESGWSQQSKKDWKNFVERLVVDTEMLDLGQYVYGRHWMPGYQHRVYNTPIKDGAVVQFTNKSTDRGRCLRDDNGTLNGQGSTCTDFILESNGKDGQYYIRSAESDNYLYASSLNSGSQVSLSKTKIPWQFDETTIGGYVAICPVSASSLAINNNTTGTTKPRLYAHGSGNGASFWQIELVGHETSVSTPTVTPTTTAQPIYDLQGRRIAIPRGIVVSNGRKVMK